ncbi:MAG: hypothetical protein FGM54_00510 [Chitinophagaceae bacterium]|nr:hypothetical protein [Chitinophagaceae bacterium]
MTPAEFSATYFHKHKLVAMCRKYGLPTQGAKLELSNRILRYLEEEMEGGGRSRRNSNSKSKQGVKPRDNFDWHTAKLTRETRITDNYKNTRNVRNFFLQTVGPHFKMNVAWLVWMRTHVGQTLGDAIKAWEETVRNKKAQRGKNTIAPQFEYNRYMRDFMADNPGMSRANAIHCWKMKRDTPGTKAYERSDRQWLL